MTPYETAKALEAGDVSFEAIAALTLAHGEKLVADTPPPRQSRDRPHSRRPRPRLALRPRQRRRLLRTRVRATFLCGRRLPIAAHHRPDPAQIAEYRAGWDACVESGDRKDWG